MPSYRAIIGDAAYFDGADALPDDVSESTDEICTFQFEAPDDYWAVIYAHAAFFDDDWNAEGSVSKVLRLPEGTLVV